MKRLIIEKRPYTISKKTMIGILECGHKTAVRENQKYAYCRQCDRTPPTAAPAE